MPAPGLRNIRPRPQDPGQFRDQRRTSGNLVGDKIHVFNIETPRKGWLFFRLAAVTGRSGDVNLDIGLKSADGNGIIHQGRGATRTTETTRFLKKDEYTVAMHVQDAEVSLLEIRLIPIIIYQRMWGSFRGMEGFPQYHREFLQRCGILECINTIGTYDGFSWRQNWIDRGRM